MARNRILLLLMLGPLALVPTATGASTPPSVAQKRKVARKKSSLAPLASAMASANGPRPRLVIDLIKPLEVPSETPPSLGTTNSRLPAPTKSTVRDELPQEEWIADGVTAFGVMAPEEVMVVAPIVDEPKDVDTLDDVVAVGDETRFHCSGIAVAPRAVLTARHCLPATRVLFGSDVSQPVVTHTITATATAPSPSDVAVVWLESPADVRLRHWHEASDGAPALLGKIVGFGATDSAAKRGAGIKRAARVPLQGWGCDLSRERTLGCLSEFELVVATPGGIDTCDGDSGGPLFERVGGEWRLLGITSRPIASARKRCGDGGIYTRIDTLAKWIRGVLQTGPGKPPHKP